MPTSTSSAPPPPDTGPAATPGPSCAAAWKPTTPPARHPPIPPTTPATPAPPTPPAAAPCNAGTPNAAGSAAHPDRRLRGGLDGGARLARLARPLDGDHGEHGQDGQAAQAVGDVGLGEGGEDPEGEEGRRGEAQDPPQGGEAGDRAGGRGDGQARALLLPGEHAIRVEQAHPPQPRRRPGVRPPDAVRPRPRKREIRREQRE